MAATAQQHRRRKRISPSSCDTVTVTPLKRGSVTSREAWQMRDSMSRDEVRVPSILAATRLIDVTRAVTLDCHVTCHAPEVLYQEAWAMLRAQGKAAKAMKRMVHREAPVEDGEGQTSMLSGLTEEELAEAVDNFRGLLRILTEWDREVSGRDIDWD